MTQYIAKRLLLVPVVVFFVVSAVFVMVRALPGDIVNVIAAEAPQYGGANELRAELGLDKPVGEQYVKYMQGVATGDFGDSLYFNRPVADQLKQAIPVTIELAVLAVTMSVIIAVPLGVLGATNRNGPIDYVTRISSVIFHSLPLFWIATLLLTALAIWLEWTPPLRYVPIWEDPIANLQQFLIPALLLALGTIGLKMRLVRAQVLEALSQDYVRTARAKGLSNSLVIRHHALRNALVPVVSIIGNQAGNLLGGAVIIETIFNLPGLGRVLIQGVGTRDYPSIQAAVLITAIFLVVVNLVTDLVYAWLDPRIRYA